MKERSFWRFVSLTFQWACTQRSVLLTVFIGGDRQPHLSGDNCEAITQKVLPDLNALLGVSQKPIMQHLTHWPRAIPQFKIGYGKYLETISKIEADYPGLQLIANYRNGISLTQCLEAAIRVKI